MKSNDRTERHGRLSAFALPLTWLARVRSSDIDWLEGGDGNDILVGSNDIAVGMDEIDGLNGGAGSDVFILGNNLEGIGAVPYYAGFGDRDYAIIGDFGAAEDVILLAGSAQEYSLGSVSNELASGTDIYYGDELN